MEEVTPARKRLIICCDGTWQSSVSGKRNIPSNVARLAREVAKAGVDHKGVTWQQIVYYDSGVGTGSLSWYEQVRQGGTGEGTVINILEAYNFLVNNYSEDIGVFKPENMQHFAPLWALYQRNLEKRDFIKTKEYFRFIHGVRPMCEKGKENELYTLKPWEVPHSDAVRPGDPLTYKDSNVVELVGVFDTVGSLGIADTKLHNHGFDRKRFEFLNVKLSPFIHHAFHAIALDEHREPFLPTLWYIPHKEDPKKPAKDKELIDKEDDDWKELEIHRRQVDERMEQHRKDYPPDLHQVWFPGYHVNVGGGADQNSADAEGLANIAFAWMVQMLGPFLAFPPRTCKVMIPSYQKTIRAENQMYERMKKEMTFEQQKQYDGLIDKSTVESVEAIAYDWGSWIVASGKKALGLAKKVEMVPVPTDKIEPEKPEIHEKWSIPEVEDSFTAMYYVMKSQYRSPGEMIDRSREDGELLKKLGDTHEYIHSSVWGRAKLLEKKSREIEIKQMDSKATDSKPREYKPKALEGFVRQQDPKFQSWGYWKESTKTWIPEWFINPSNEFLEQSDLPEAKSVISDKGKHVWQYVEWKATENLSGTQELQKDLAEFYIEATKAKKKMEAAGKEFPFDVPKW